MPWPPARRVASIHSAMALSQGQRSASVSGSPRCIFSILARGWNRSPSSLIQCRRWASIEAMVLLPEPETPITTMMVVSLVALPASMSLLRRGGADDEPDQVALAIGASRRQILAAKHAAQDRALFRAVDEEQHFTARRQRRKCQRDARRERFHAGFGDAERPALRLIEGRGVREQRSGVAVAAKSHQHKIEQRAPWIEPLGAVKFLQIVFVESSRAFGIIRVGWDRMDGVVRRADAIEQQSPRHAHIVQGIAFRNET